MIISVQAADSPKPCITLKALEDFCEQVRAAGGRDDNRVTGATRGWGGRTYRLSVDTTSGSERRED